MSTITYSRQGSGEPLVLIHGIGHSRSAWDPVVAELAKSFDVVVLDLPGFGQSPAPTAPDSYSMSSYVAQLEAFFAHLGIERPHVAGNSLGGAFALNLASRGTVRSATAISPAGFWTPLGLVIVGINLLTMKASTYAPRPVLKLFADKPALRKLSMRSLYVHPERLDARTALADTYALRNAPGFWPVFKRGAFMRPSPVPIMPTTVAWGDKDRLLVPSQAKRAAQRFTKLRHVALPNCGHVPMLDDPKLVAEVIVATTKQGERAAEAAPAAG